MQGEVLRSGLRRRYLWDAGIAVFGLDVSPKMVKEARRLHPDIRFEVGNMMALGLQDSGRSAHLMFT